MFGFTVEVRDKTLARIGQILPVDLNLSINELFNNVGTWTLVLANGHPMVPVLRTPGAGIIVTRTDTGNVLMSGPVVSPTLDVSAATPAGTVTISGVTDSVILSDRLAYPQPSNDNAATQTAANDTRTGVAEDLMHAYVTANVGPTAPASRIDGRIAMGTNAHRGDSLTKAPRFQVLGALLDEIGSVANYPTGTGRQLGFRMVQVGAAVQFQTYATNDQSAAVRFDVDNGTLASSKVATAAPNVTRTIVGGQGDGTARTIVEVSGSVAWAAEAAWGRRIETFIDQRQTSDPAQLTAAGNDALASGGLSQFAMQITPADDAAWVYGIDYSMGDYVTVVVRAGGTDPLGATELSTMVTGYVLKADSSGTRFGAQLGQPAGDQLASFTSRLSNLETSGTGASGTTGTVTGNFTVQDATTPTKGIRLRTTGSALDVDAAAAALSVSTWTGVGFTGTQNTKMTLPNGTGPVTFPQGVQSSVAASAANDVVRKADLLALIYPVGSIYLAATSTNPATLFGGTWTQIKDQFILAAGTTYAAASTGGAASATLSAANLPSHTHPFSAATDSQGTHTHSIGRDRSGTTGTVEYVNHSTGITGATQTYSGQLTSDGAHTHSISGTSGATGSGTAFSTLPPYLAVYVWQRTA